MSHITPRRFILPFSSLLFAALLLLVCVPVASTQRSATKSQGTDAPKEDEPFYKEYKGVSIGMTADEARKKLGNPADKGDTQDFYLFGENETAQVFYDGSRKVTAVSVSYLGDVTKAPTAKAVLGDEVEPKPDGSVHRLVRYPKAGYWVSYSRTAGDSPMITVAMQKL